MQEKNSHTGSRIVVQPVAHDDYPDDYRGCPDSVGRRVRHQAAPGQDADDKLWMAERLAQGGGAGGDVEDRRVGLGGERRGRSLVGVLFRFGTGYGRAEERSRCVRREVRDFVALLKQVRKKLPEEVSYPELTVGKW